MVACWWVEVVESRPGISRDRSGTYLRSVVEIWWKEWESRGVGQAGRGGVVVGGERRRVFGLGVVGCWICVGEGTCLLMWADVVDDMGNREADVYSVRDTQVCQRHGRSGFGSDFYHCSKPLCYLHPT